MKENRLFVRLRDLVSEGRLGWYPKGWLIEKTEKNKGQTLIESVIVMGLAMMTVGAIVSVLLGGMKADREARNRARATSLAEEEVALIEGVRDMMSRDDYLNYAEINDVWCDPSLAPIECHIDESARVKIDTLEVVGYEEVEFMRSYITEKPRVGCGVDAIGMKVTVSWRETSGAKQVVIWRCVAPPSDYR